MLGRHMHSFLEGKPALEITEVTTGPGREDARGAGPVWTEKCPKPKVYGSRLQYLRENNHFCRRGRSRHCAPGAPSSGGRRLLCAPVFIGHECDRRSRACPPRPVPARYHGSRNDGLELCRRIRQTPTLAMTPVIFLT